MPFLKPFMPRTHTVPGFRLGPVISSSGRAHLSRPRLPCKGGRCRTLSRLRGTVTVLTVAIVGLVVVVLVVVAVTIVEVLVLVLVRSSSTSSILVLVLILVLSVVCTSTDDDAMFTPTGYRPPSTGTSTIALVIVPVVVVELTFLDLPRKGGWRRALSRLRGTRSQKEWAWQQQRQHRRLRHVPVRGNSTSRKVRS